MRLLLRIGLTGAGARVEDEPMTAAPVTVVIPGFMGSTLADAGSGKVLWDSFRLFWTDLRKLRFDQGLEIEALRDLWPVYRSLMRNLRRRGHRVLFFPYDWRRSAEQAAAEFGLFIKKYVPDGPLNIVSHSMGGFVTALWLADGGAERFESNGRIACVAMPAKGVEMALLSMVAGYSLLALYNFRADRRLVRELAWEVPSLYEMLPHYPKVCDPDVWPEGLGVKHDLLAEGRRMRERFESSLPVLGELGREGSAALFAAQGRKTVGIRFDDEGRLDPKPTACGDGDGWVLAESVEVDNVPTYLFRLGAGDSLGLGIFAVLGWVVGSHPLLPMFKRINRAIIGFLETGTV